MTNLQDVPIQIGETVTNMSLIGVSFIRRSYFFSEPSPVSFWGQKKIKFYNGANGDTALWH